MPTDLPAETREPEPAQTAAPNWDELGCLAIYTLFGWAFIGACIHDWMVGKWFQGWGELVPYAFCVFINVSTTIEWVRYAKWRRLPLAERLNSCPFTRIRELSPQEAALLEEQLGRRSRG
jgi:hypothetical protein